MIKLINPFETSIEDGVVSAKLSGDLTIEGNVNIKGDASNNSVKMAVITTGVYTGNDTANRAIPHTLGIKPKFVYIMRAIQAIASVIHKDDLLYGGNSGSDWAWAVTAMDSINFYVGNASKYDQSMNANATEYYWVALA